jgi:glycerate kinase
MRLLVAPQEFKGTLSAEEAADAIALGIRDSRPAWTVDRLPLSDGGPGFVDALRRAVRADAVAAAVHDALGREVLGRYLLLKDGTAVIEAAQANGLMHIAEEERDALRADSYGVGELIREALATRPPKLVVGVGGSATTDGGAGMARALGARFRDMAGNPLPPGGAALAGLARIDWAPPAELEGVEVVVATDVTNPLTGPSGAAAVYAPQKGATPADAEVLEPALVRYAAVVRRSLGIDVASLPGGGAAGGLAAGLVAFLGARIVSGFDVVAEATGLHQRLAAADVVVTGEGCFDRQSLQGKAAWRLSELAATAGKRCVILAGTCQLTQDAVEVHTLAEVEPDPARQRSEAAATLRQLARRWAAAN